ncbi:unnamed protein product [Pleuronectes platessa]|uniref:Uncharacterized protein n=1 Tax=Pleuronectes platessa TaxID=8262 RepID=A0A9N7Z971_PLEPL|nr:unnamed protein product [Pleuronectes platessa]
MEMEPSTTITTTATTAHSPVWLMDGGPLRLAPCCDRQQMFSNNVYRPGLHLRMTHTCFQSNRPREAIHPRRSWVATALTDLPSTQSEGCHGKEQCHKGSTTFGGFIHCFSTSGLKYLA